MTWFDLWKFKINEKKTELQVFTKRIKYDNPIIRVNRKIIHAKPIKKLLGLKLDAPRLNWNAHIDDLATDCRRRLDVMKSISSTHWGASRKVLRMFYIAYVRSKMEYGCEVFSGGHERNVEVLNKIQNSALRLIIGGRNTTPILSLQAESYIEPLTLRYQFLIARTYMKLCHRPMHDETCLQLNVVSHNRALNMTNYGPVGSFKSRALKCLEVIGIFHIKRIHNDNYSAVPPHQPTNTDVVFSVSPYTLQD